MNTGRLILGLLVILFGVSVFIDIPVFKFAFALMVIWLGIRVLTGKEGSFMGNDERGETAEDEINRVMIFSGINRKFVSNDFKGGDIVAIFGGGEIDLSDVKTKQETIELDIVAVLGGLKIIVPETWSVRSEGVGILGGFDSKVKSKEKGTKAVIKGVAILGGVEVETP